MPQSVHIPEGKRIQFRKVIRLVKPSFFIYRFLIFEITKLKSLLLVNVTLINQAWAHEFSPRDQGGWPEVLPPQMGVCTWAFDHSSPRSTCHTGLLEGPMTGQFRKCFTKDSCCAGSQINSHMKQHSLKLNSLLYWKAQYKHCTQILRLPAYELSFFSLKLFVQKNYTAILTLLRQRARPPISHSGPSHMVI